MGDRANIVIREDWPSDLGQKEAVFLYTHWAGSELPETLHYALSRRERWDDPQYLARIVFQAMTGDDREATGYGISTRLGDNEYDLLVLHNGRVYVLSEQDYKDKGFDALNQPASLSFEDYISVPRTWENLGDSA